MAPENVAYSPLDHKHSSAIWSRTILHYHFSALGELTVPVLVHDHSKVRTQLPTSSAIKTDPLQVQTNSYLTSQTQSPHYVYITQNKIAPGHTNIITTLTYLCCRMTLDMLQNCNSDIHFSSWVQLLPPLFGNTPFENFQNDMQSSVFSWRKIHYFLTQKKWGTLKVLVLLA